jgi:hypothetical protein
MRKIRKVLLTMVLSKELVSGKAETITVTALVILRLPLKMGVL